MLGVDLWNQCKLLIQEVIAKVMPSSHASRIITPSTH